MASQRPVEHHISENPIGDLEQILVATTQTMQEVLATAQADGRTSDLTAEEIARFDAAQAQHDKAKASIERHRAAQDAQSSTSAPRQAVSDRTPLPSDAVRSSTGQRQRIEYVEGPKSQNGWRSFGEFFNGVIRAGQGRGIDPRFFGAAPTTAGNEGTSADGGYAVPTPLLETVYKKVLGESSLLPLTDQYVTASNTLNIPVDTSAPWAAAGVQASWGSENTAATQTKPALGTLALPLYRLNCLVPLSDELIEDSPAVNSWLPGKIGDRMTSAINEAIIVGTASGQPDGILASPGQVTVAAKSGQGAGTVVFENIVAMYAAMMPQNTRNACWIINPAVMPQLLALVGPGYAPGAWMPPNNTLANAPYGTLLGRPVISSEFCSALGTAGDILLVDLKSYATATKGSGIQMATSVHLYFDAFATALRASIRLAGASTWAGTVASKNGSKTYGNVVALNSTRT